MKTSLSIVVSLLAVASTQAQSERVVVSGHGGVPTEHASAKGDPRLVGLPVGPGGVPRGGEIEMRARDDQLFAAGMALFDRSFHRAEGVGAPEMNADSCRGCHRDPSIGGAGGLELNVSRFGDDGNGTTPFRNLPGGQGLSKLRPSWFAGREEYDPNDATCFEQRQTPLLLGGGQIDSIADAVILAGEDPQDQNGDGIFGVARRVDIGGVIEVGRFGWKAQVPRLRDFIMDAMSGEMGMTTPDDGRGFALLVDNDNVADPEVSPDQVDALDHFLSLLPAPRFRHSDRRQVYQGEALFTTIGCATCHVPALDGANGPVRLYSNLLLHDVMADDFRGMAEPGAGVGMYRTPPLWGISFTAPYMHDGRAATLRDAIGAHEGEADGVRQNFEALAVSQQDAVIEFLQRL